MERNTNYMALSNDDSERQLWFNSTCHQEHFYIVLDVKKYSK